MLYLECDYNNGCHNKVLEKIVESNAVPQCGYGDDMFTASAKEKIRKVISCPDADVFFLAGGTQTNSTVISGIIKSYEGAIAADSGHIATHESGAVEYTGHKVITLSGHDGKLDPEELKNYLEDYFSDDTYEHMVFPGMVYISFPTELGTIYKKAELERIHNICRSYNIPLYIDGARLGYGLASYECDISFPEFASLCDVFYIGGTKVGALCGEAVVFPKGDAPEHFFSIIKQHGALLAKGRLAGVQFDALFSDGLYMEIGRHAIDMAEKLKSIIREKGIPFYLETSTNQQFVILENAKVDELHKKMANCFWSKYDDSHTVLRFCTSWATTERDLEELEIIL